MKTIKSLLTFGLSAVTALTITSCQDFDFMDEAEIKHDLTVNEYTKNFINHYGSVDPNHTWGFESMNPVQLGTRAYTRAADFGGVGSVSTNRNQWASKQNGEYIQEALMPNISIPGWPNFDGYYYADEGNYASEPTTDKNPCGDVTEFEIQYVANYFRTHTRSEMERDMVQLHLTDFFIQDVCSDADQTSYDQTNWGKGENKTTILSNNESCDFQMDQLRFKTFNSNPYNAERHEVDDTWTHINNFNRGKQNFDPENNLNKNTNRTIMYVTSSGTEDFAYHSSFNTTSAFFNDWVLVRLTWQEKGLDDKMHNREGYYLAFNYETFKDNEEIYQKDNYYSNWIVKISPAVPFKNAPDVKRVMCEDLGNTYDFDFNDVVFDVYFEYNTKKGQHEAVITLQAAGGTMPIYVGVDPDGSTPHAEDYEAHKMLGNDDKTPVNVGGAAHSVAIYRIPVNNNEFNADNVAIYVEDLHGAAHTITSTSYNNGQKGSDNVPQKFAVPTSVKWMQECKFIETGYPKFKNWVNNEHFNDNGKKWYEINVNEGFTYNYNVTKYPSASQPGNEVLDNKYNITITVDPSEGGYVTYNNQATTSITGLVRSSIVTVTAVPNSGYEFEKWEDGSTNAERSIMVVQDMNIKAVFKPTTSPAANVDNSQYISVSGNIITIQASNCTLTDEKLYIDASYFSQMTDFSTIKAHIEYSGVQNYVGFNFEGIDGIWGNAGSNPDNEGRVTLDCDALYNSGDNLCTRVKTKGLSLKLSGKLPDTIVITCGTNSNSKRR